MGYKLKVASVVDLKCSTEPQTRAVTAILKHWNYDYEPIVDPLWYGWASKMMGFIEHVRYLSIYDEHTHLMFIDARDVVVLAAPDAIMERYLEFNHPWVYSAEPFIWSQGSFEPDEYPPCDTPYRYLNAGVSIGEIGHLLQCFNKWTEHGVSPPNHLPNGDQDWMAARYLGDYPDAIKLDTRCELMQCACGSQIGDKPHIELSPGRVYNQITDTEPLIVHFNGGTDITDNERRILWQHLV